MGEFIGTSERISGDSCGISLRSRSGKPKKQTKADSRAVRQHRVGIFVNSECYPEKKQDRHDGNSALVIGF